MAKDKGITEALSRIQEVKRLGATSLALSGLSLEAAGQYKEFSEAIGQLTQLTELDLSRTKLTVLPESVGQLSQLAQLHLNANQLTSLPESIGQLSRLLLLDLSGNQLTTLPESFKNLARLRYLYLGLSTSGGNPITSVPLHIRSLRQLKHFYSCECRIDVIPEWIGELENLEKLDLYANQVRDLPQSLLSLQMLSLLGLGGNPLNPELAAARKEGLDAVKRYLRAKASAQVVLNEAKLILVGEGEVGKSCLLGALRGDEWVEGRLSTHGIEIKPVKVADPHKGVEITLNGWDFGGQRVYRPTHQLFFSAPAVYLVVWKPREGSQQGLVKEWIKLINHREPDAKILVVATHGGPGGPGACQPDIDRQEIWDQFGKETVIDFFHVDSYPPTFDKKTKKRTGMGKGVQELKDAITRVAAGLPEMGRTFPEHWQKAREALKGRKEAYLPLGRVLAICKDHQIEDEDARLLLRICRRVGDLIHFEHDPLLRDIVILKPDWLAKAIGFVLADEHTREKGRGLVDFPRLGTLWHDPKRPEEDRYPTEMHRVFLRLMEQFDLSYRVVKPGKSEKDGTSLIAQLVPDIRPEKELASVWPAAPSLGDTQQVQICQIVDTAKNQSANAEGLFYQLIVRLHRYSLGRADYAKSIHWQRGLVLEDDTGARAFLEHIANDIRITVRSPYPERFLAALTYDVEWLVGSFWEGLRCEVTVPCTTTSADGGRCSGLFDVKDLMDDLKNNRPEQKCSRCKRWLPIETLLRNAPAARANPIDELIAKQDEVLQQLDGIRVQLREHDGLMIGRFDRVDAAGREIVSKVKAAYTGLMRTLLDEAKDGPRLFSLEPVDSSFLRPGWVSQTFRITLWCEHSRRPLWYFTPEGDKSGIYEVTIPRDWLVKSAPILKTFTTILSLVVPVVVPAANLLLDETAYKNIEKGLKLGEKCFDSVMKGGKEVGEWIGKDDAPDVPHGEGIRARGAVLRQLHVWLKKEDPGFGGLVRVQNKRQEFLWVHPQFESEASTS